VTGSQTVQTYRLSGSRVVKTPCSLTL
jgi:hypothetical protein